MKRESITIETLGDLVDRRMHVSGWCAACQRMGNPDMSALVKRLGRDHVFIRSHQLKHVLRCRACSREASEIRIHVEHVIPEHQKRMWK